MSRTDSSLTIEQLKELFAYEPFTGKVTRLKRTPKCSKAIGSEVGAIDDEGYRRAVVCGKYLAVHRLAWALNNGAWPEGQVDHINGVRSDNRLANLRVVTPALNSQNQRKAKRHSSTGLLGVHTSGKKFIAQIGVDRKVRYLGTFDDADSAHQAYLKEKRMVHEGCTI